MIYQKTALGHRVLHDRSVPLAPKHRMLFILIDGKTPSADILQSTTSLGVNHADILQLLELNLIEPVSHDLRPTSPLPSNLYEPTSQVSQASNKTTSHGDTPKIPHLADALSFNLDAEVKKIRYQNAYPLAVEITSRLGLGGFRLNLAVEQAMGYEDLVALLPRIEKAAGTQACSKLHEILLQPLSN